MSDFFFPGVSIGIYEKALPARLNWRERLAMAAEAGFDFVEMSLDPSTARLSRLSWTAKERRDLRRAVEESGVTIRTMCLSAHRAYPLGCGNESIRQQGEMILRQALDLAGDLGIRIVQIAGYDTLPDETSDESSGSRYTDSLAQGVQWAAARAVMMGLENQEEGCIDSPTTAVKLIAAINSPYLKLYMDVGNLVVKNLDVVREIEIARGHLVGVHVKDARPGVPRRVPFGQGDVPFDAAFRQLAAIGFAGPMMIEMWNEDRDDALAICTQARGWIEKRLLEAGFSQARQVLS